MPSRVCAHSLHTATEPAAASSFTSGTPPKPLWYDTPFGKEEENAFSLEGLRHPVSEPGEQIAEQFEG